MSGHGASRAFASRESHRSDSIVFNYFGDSFRLKKEIYKSALGKSRLPEYVFDRLAARGSEPELMEELARVYSRALFEVAQAQDKLELVREQLSALVQALQENRELALFFFSPYFSTQEKQDALHRVLTDAVQVRATAPDFSYTIELRG